MTDEALRAYVERHVPSNDSELCTRCGQEWPCDAAMWGSELLRRDAQMEILQASCDALALSLDRARGLATAASREVNR